jgi:hypothetical protein
MAAFELLMPPGLEMPPGAQSPMNAMGKRKSTTRGIALGLAPVGGGLLVNSKLTAGTKYFFAAFRHHASIVSPFGRYFNRGVGSSWGLNVAKKRMSSGFLDAICLFSNGFLVAC